MSNFITNPNSVDVLSQNTGTTIRYLASNNERTLNSTRLNTPRARSSHTVWNINTPANIPPDAVRRNAWIWTGGATTFNITSPTWASDVIKELKRSNFIPENIDINQPTQHLNKLFYTETLFMNKGTGTVTLFSSTPTNVTRSAAFPFPIPAGQFIMLKFTILQTDPNPLACLIRISSETFS